MKKLNVGDRGLGMDKKKLLSEIKSFRKLWRGGTSRPKMGWKKSIQRAKAKGTVDLEKIVEVCIDPYVNSCTNVFEIGAGGGFWTQKMLHAETIICFDALSAEHNKFWDRIKSRNKIEYFQVQDFECNELEDNSVDYVFSYDVFCHISYSGAEAYLKNMYDKLKDGANCFVMIADANKYDDKVGRRKLMKLAGFSNFKDFVDDYDGPPNNGRWYFYGTELFCGLLSKYGYTLISNDVAVRASKLSPIIHFRK